MTTQSNTCTRCGKTLYDGIHTCSPQVKDSAPDADLEAFEAWIQDELNYGYDLKKDPSGNYLHDATDTAWLAWQAALLARQDKPHSLKVRNFRSPTGWTELYGTKEDCDAVQKLIDTPVQAVPDGYKLVPIEPTKAMISAGKLAVYQSSVGDLDPADLEIHHAYLAMIDAVKEPNASSSTDCN